MIIIIIICQYYLLRSVSSELSISLLLKKKSDFLDSFLGSGVEKPTARKYIYDEIYSNMCHRCRVCRPILINF